MHLVVEERGLAWPVPLSQLHKELLDECGVSGSGGTNVRKLWMSSVRRNSIPGLVLFLLDGIHDLARFSLLPNLKLSTSSWMKKDSDSSKSSTPSCFLGETSFRMLNPDRDNILLSVALLSDN